MTVEAWDAHAAQRLAQDPPKPLAPPVRMEWTQRPGIGPGTEVLGGSLCGRRIVELGCGPGRNTAHLAGLGARVTGIDSSRGQIRRAAAHYGHTGAEFVRSTASAYLNGERERLDAIVSIFGAIGLTEPFKLLVACSRRLSRNGMLAFSVPHPQRTGTIPASPRTRDQLTLPDGTPTVVERWDIGSASWVQAINRAGLLVTGVQDLFAPVDARWPTTLLITTRMP
ncbi:class I SAM-dependent methyltransferase [Streptomyces kaniharaensis]|uniref:Class I SAM-dependent methyltransferase n=1 Tax=Streptomyces kaniharaensis TaxID=212423 RepID=A0A6N7KLH1_9ACTN|nr:class I SAM-dependent methyltransferase [Streptomyces kaniharaensis]MQS11197.1 class I SAM-dependent methyltransferase [Streptomyces kaniharaensis]